MKTDLRGEGVNRKKRWGGGERSFATTDKNSVGGPFFRVYSLNLRKMGEQI